MLILLFRKYHDWKDLPTSINILWRRIGAMWHMLHCKLFIIFGLSLLVLYSPLRGFSPVALVFPSHQKPQ